MVVAVTAYGMATFEGPMLSLKNVNAISHFTDWTVAHVHVGGLGWNGMLLLVFLLADSKNFQNRTCFQKNLPTSISGSATLGIIFYAVPMYWAGFTQASCGKNLLKPVN